MTRSPAIRRRSSHTAAKVARGVVFLAGDPVHARLLPEGAAESIERLCLAAGVLKPKQIRLFEAPWFRRFAQWLDKAVFKGEFMRLTLRKRFVDDEVRAAIDAGAQQLLIIGPGFDTLGLRIAARHAEVTVLEVDAPATAERRRAALQRMNGRYSNHQLVSADLSQTSLRDTVRNVDDWRPNLQTAVVAEGVIMYLTEAEVSALLEDIREMTAPGSRLVFTYIKTDAKGQPTVGGLTKVLRVSLAIVGEPFRWGMQPQLLEAFLEQRGFRLCGPPNRFDLRSRYLIPSGIDQRVGDAELMGVAETLRTS